MLQGGRPGPPEVSHVYREVMTACWLHDWSSRLTFSEVLSRLEATPERQVETSIADTIPSEQGVDEMPGPGANDVVVLTV